MPNLPSRYQLAIAVRAAVGFDLTMSEVIDVDLWFSLGALQKRHRGKVSMSASKRAWAGE